MKALKYEVKICDSILDSNHGFYYTITEIYVPKLEIVFNEKGGLFKIDKDNCSRVSKENISNVKDIEVKKTDMLVLVDFLEHKQDCSKIIKNYFPDVEKIL
jgi:hypothetical protein